MFAEIGDGERDEKNRLNLYDGFPLDGEEWHCVPGRAAHRQHQQQSADLYDRTADGISLDGSERIVIPEANDVDDDYCVLRLEFPLKQDGTDRVVGQ